MIRYIYNRYLSIFDTISIINDFSNILTNDEKERLEYKKSHKENEKQKILDALNIEFQ